jgi:hypothetical protein
MSHSRPTHGPRDRRTGTVVRRTLAAVVSGVLVKTLPYGKQLLDPDDIAAVTAQLGDDWLTRGPTVAKFEAALYEITGTKHAIARSEIASA